MNDEDLVVGFRIGDYISPLRVNGSRHEGRFHRRGEIVQYFSLHPLGAFAEYVRRERPTFEMLGEFRHRLWAARLPVKTATTVDWASAPDFQITPAELIADDYGPCQDLADRLRAAGVRDILVPSAALPGVRNLVMLGERAPSPFNASPLDANDIPVTVAADDATIPESLLEYVRYPGQPHAELDAYLLGELFVFVEPPPTL